MPCSHPVAWYHRCEVAACTDPKRICRIGGSVQAFMPVFGQPGKSDWLTFRISRAWDTPEGIRYQLVRTVQYEGHEFEIPYSEQASACRPV